MSFKRGRMCLESSKNDLRFLNLLSIFCQTEIIFRLTIIFVPTKYRKMPKSFYAETNGA
jgi:hypothetical protein